jgi:NTP pyrophosphatase (non-canonical NTP hydrolase)
MEQITIVILIALCITLFVGLFFTRRDLKRERRERIFQESFQERVQAWVMDCMPNTTKIERAHRFLEEALELVQACGCKPREVELLVDYVFNRSIGNKEQEVGGVLLTLAALCSIHQLDMRDAGNKELLRVWIKKEVIKAKHDSKPSHSPLPGSVPE